jgi:enoyl-CoA hydratase/carnithine racemase
MFAMPETGIGFFPDVGGSWFLPRLKGAMGMFLALSGHRLKGMDVLAAGVATHFVDEARLDALEAVLLEAKSEDDVQASLAAFCSHPVGASYDAVLPQIERCYGPDKKTVEEIVAALEADGSEWAVGQLATLHRMSPLSLKVTFRQMREGAQLKTFGECLAMEFRMCVRVMQSGEFFEGVRCLLVDKEKTRAKWKYNTLADVPEEVVAGHFAPLGPDSGCKELTF